VELGYIKRFFNSIWNFIYGQDMFSVSHNPFISNGSESTGSWFGGLVSISLIILMLMLTMLKTMEMTGKTDQSVSQFTVPATIDELETMYDEANLENITFGFQIKDKSVNKTNSNGSIYEFIDMLQIS
jgi:hypothetical protein